MARGSGYLVVLVASLACARGIDQIGPMLANCRSATVTLHVQNESSFDLRLGLYGMGVPKRAYAFRHTDIEVPRSALGNRGYLTIEATGGGLTIGERVVQVFTEAPFCRDATLVVASAPRYSIFYGDAPQSGRHSERR